MRIERLLADPSEEVRRDMAFQVANLEEFPEVVALGQRAAESDPSFAPARSRLWPTPCPYSR